MKNVVSIILAAGALVLTGCSSTQDTVTADSQKSAIESVLAQRAKIEKEHVGSLGGERLAALMAIDVHGCPADFRSAWFEYLVAAQILHTRVERTAGIGLAVGKPVTDLPSLIKFAASSPELGVYLLTGLGKVDDAWGKVEVVGMDYGVMPKIEVSDISHRPNTRLEPTPTAP
jgi:hypothetical protein